MGRGIYAAIRGQREKKLFTICGGQNTEIAAGPRNPRHVIEANIGIGFLRETLHEKQSIKIQQRIGEGESAHGPCRVVFKTGIWCS